MRLATQITRELMPGDYWRFPLAYDLNEVEQLQVTHAFFNEKLWLQTHFPELYVWLSFHSCVWGLGVFDPIDQIWMKFWTSQDAELFWETWGMSYTSETV